MFPSRTLKLGFMLISVCAVLSQEEQRPCLNQWRGDLASSQETCNVLDGPKSLTMTCRISLGTSNVSLVWMYAESWDGEPKGTALLEGQSNVDFTYEVEVSVVSSGRSRAAQLTLHSTFSSGFYWCMSGEVAEAYQNPSRIMRINTDCYPDPNVPCSTSSELTLPQEDGGRCANGNYQENITIINLQDNLQCPSEVTDGNLINRTAGDMSDFGTDSIITTPLPSPASSGGTNGPDIPNTAPSTNENTTTLVSMNSDPFFPTGKGFSPLWIGIVALLGFLVVIAVLISTIAVVCSYIFWKKNQETLIQVKNYKDIEVNAIESVETSAGQNVVGAEYETVGMAMESYAVAPNTGDIENNTNENSKRSQAEALISGTDSQTIITEQLLSEESEIYSVVSERKKYEKFELTDCPAYESNKFELVTCPAYYPVANTVDEEESYVIM